ncbi:MAG: hypothetical protein ACI91O_000580 [Candidatus Poriferisodalaceae bacterium]
MLSEGEELVVGEDSVACSGHDVAEWVATGYLVQDTSNGVFELEDPSACQAASSASRKVAWNQVAMDVEQVRRRPPAIVEPPGQTLK